MIERRKFLAVLAGTLVAGSRLMAGAGGQIRVVRSPDCGCCGAWIIHLQDNGFIVEDVFSDQLEAVKDLHAVPQHLRSCHTAFVNNYIIEGHVPARDIQRLLDERPQADGLAVPGMPLGSPGMEMGDRMEPFDVVMWSGAQTQVFSTY